MIDSMRARIKDIPPEQEASWGAVVAVLRFDNRERSSWHWTAHRPPNGKPFTIIDIEVDGQDLDALRAELSEAVDLVNDIVDRDPLKSLVRADIGLSEVYLK